VRGDICWTGAGRSGVARSAGHYEKCLEGSSGVDAGYMGPVMPVVCLSIPGCARGSGWVVPTSLFPLTCPCIRRPGRFCLRVWRAVPACTWLSVELADGSARTYI
jgi:hypothetical protein